MTDLPRRWQLYEAGEAVIRPRRRPVFYRGRRRSDRVKTRLVVILAVLLLAVTVGHFFPITASRADEPVALKTAMQVPYFRNCADVHAAGIDTLRRGEPGYASWLDADGDGLACEPWRSNR